MISSIGHKGVTSDLKPWHTIGNFIFCNKCGHSQKEICEEWIADAEKIYTNYESCPLGEGREQLVFRDSGLKGARFSVLLDKLFEVVDIPAEGKILDIGCSCGRFLHRFSERRPDWECYGYEYELRSDDVFALHGVEKVYSGELSKIDKKFDLVVMTHVIEHLLEPVEILKSVYHLINETGWLFVQAPCFVSNPFDLVIRDHCSHFTTQSLKTVANLGGFSLIEIMDDWVPREIGFIARKDNSVLNQVVNNTGSGSIRSSLEFLSNLLDKVKSVSNGRPFGVLGASISGLWLAHSLDRDVDFFGDEDLARQGDELMGIPIFSVDNIPTGSTVVVPFSSLTAESIVKRLKARRQDIRFILP
ncbi:class I SAM-dependent methyltransferase [Maridesulfovibrio sp.]|uniref:class I SAM-dependent methyltransferase n=1 Tax=Maridesulfovibrio sp. TaxID=2795000 RepID=UPI002A18E8D2|nr:class I SAM-dependent methyltransferase [Maridesulfovibrio sp.]